MLEALAAGLPCACSRIEPLVSNAGAAALYFDPHDIAAIRGAMERLTTLEAIHAVVRSE